MHSFKFSVRFQEKKSINKIVYFQCKRHKRRPLTIINDKIINAYRVTLKTSNSERILRVNFDSVTNFQFHITNLCFNRSRKLHAPAHKKALHGSSKKWMLFLSCSLTIAHLFGCITAVHLITKKSYLKDVLAEYIVTKLPFFWRFFNKIVPCINSHEDHTHSHKWNV